MPNVCLGAYLTNAWFEGLVDKCLYEKPNWQMLVWGLIGNTPARIPTFLPGSDRSDRVRQHDQVRRFGLNTKHTNMSSSICGQDKTQQVRGKGITGQPIAVSFGYCPPPGEGKPATLSYLQCIGKGSEYLRNLSAAYEKMQLFPTIEK